MGKEVFYVIWYYFFSSLDLIVIVILVNNCLKWDVFKKADFIAYFAMVPIYASIEIILCLLKRCESIFGWYIMVRSIPLVFLFIIRVILGVVKRRMAGFNEVLSNVFLGLILIIDFSVISKVLKRILF